MTLDEEFDRKFPQELVRKSLNWGLEDDPKDEIKSWFKSYTLSLMESVKLGRNPFDPIGDSLDNLRVEGYGKASTTKKPRLKKN